MKRFVHVIALAVMMLILTACSSGKVVYNKPSNKLSADGKAWTVMVYMCGGKSETETGAFSDKLEQMMRLEYPENVNVVVQTGGSSEWKMKGVYGDYLQRFEMGKGTMYLADQAMAVNMGDYRVLEDFLSWGTSNYKADNYMLIISGTGGGSIHGMAFDELNGYDSLNLEEISYAMSVAGKNFDIVALDASLMGSIETASALSTCTDYLIAPQEVQSADNWDYEGMLKYICENPSADTEDICKAVCDTYYARCVKNGTQKDAAMSVVDMSKVSTLTQAFDGMVGNMLTATDAPDLCGGLLAVMDTVHMYGGGSVDEGFSNLVDIGNTAMRIRDYVGNTADAFIEALNDAIVYRVCGEHQKNSTGLGMYYPISTNSDELQRYMEIVPSEKYREFVKKICVNCMVSDETNTPDFTASWSWYMYQNDMQWLQYQTILDGNMYGVNIVGNMMMFKDIGINLYKKDKKTGKYSFVGKYTDLDADWESGIFKDGFNCKMLRLFGKNVTSRLVRKYDDADIYAIPVSFNGERASVRVRNNKKGDSWEIIGVWSGLDAFGQATEPIREIGMLDSVSPCLSVYDNEHKKTEYIITSGGWRLFGGVGESTTDNGDYILEYELTDMYGLKRWGTPVEGHISGGKLKFE